MVRPVRLGMVFEPSIETLWIIQNSALPIASPQVRRLPGALDEGF
jgi:hypothetical protein